MLQEISYARLLSCLEIENVRELEDLLISDCFYPGLLKGKLDQKQRCLHVHEAVARDIRPENIPTLVTGLGTWYASNKNRSNNNVLLPSFANEEHTITVPKCRFGQPKDRIGGDLLIVQIAEGCT